MSLQILFAVDLFYYRIYTSIKFSTLLRLHAWASSLQWGRIREKSFYLVLYNGNFYRLTFTFYSNLNEFQIQMNETENLKIRVWCVCCFLLRIQRKIGSSLDESLFLEFNSVFLLNASCYILFFCWLLDQIKKIIRQIIRKLQTDKYCIELLIGCIQYVSVCNFLIILKLYSLLTC